MTDETGVDDGCGDAEGPVASDSPEVEGSGRSPMAVGRVGGGVTEVKLGDAAQADVRESKISGPWTVEVVVRGEGSSSSSGEGS